MDCGTVDSDWIRVSKKGKRTKIGKGVLNLPNVGATGIHPLEERNKYFLTNLIDEGIDEEGPKTGLRYPELNQSFLEKRDEKIKKNEFDSVLHESIKRIGNPESGGKKKDKLDFVLHESIKS